MDIATPETENTYTLEPDGPRFNYTPGGVILSMSETDLQHLAIIAQVFNSTSTEFRRSTVPGYRHSECGVDELARFIADAT